MHRYTRFVFVALLSIFACCASAAAQQTSSTDATTPTGQAKGAPPLGSFGGSDFDRVNLFNGNVTMSFPLAPSNGRAGMGAAATLAYNSKFWRLVVDRTDPSHTMVFPTVSEWDRGGTYLAPGWRINTGRLVARHSGWNPTTLAGCPGGVKGNTSTLTRLTFVAADGTEYEFRDTQDDSDVSNDGEPHYNGDNCGEGQIYNRKKIWITYDGTAATFVSTADIWDNAYVVEGSDPPIESFPSGTLYLKDGTTYGITNGRVDWMQDRNGNRVTYSYYAAFPYNGFLSQITDTLGRVTTFTYDVTDPDDGVTKLLVRVVQQRDPGTSTDDRVWKVVGKKLNVLQRGLVDIPQTAPTLGELWSSSNSTPFNDRMPASIVLPSGHTWKFEYNRYGEVALAENPAHGKIEYDVIAAAGNTPTGVNAFAFRYCSERRTYKRGTDNTASYEERTVYDDPTAGYNPVSPPASTTVTEVRYAANAKLNRTKHTFYSSPLAGYYRPGNSDEYTPWQEGLEYLTEDAGYVSNAWVERSKEETTWRQAAAVLWVTTDPDAPGQPGNNTRIVNRKTTIVENSLNLVSKVEYNYDTTPYNNVTQEIYYDWGSGSPSATKLRQIDRTYEKTAAYTSATASPVVHVRNLVLTESTSKGGTAESTTTNVYDGVGVDILDCPGLSTSTHNSAFGSTADGTTRTKRGNLTSTTADPLDGNAVSTTKMQYDEAGNTVMVISPNWAKPGANVALYTTEIQYRLSLADGDPDPVYAFPVGTKRKVSKASGGTATDLATTAIFNRWTGLMTSKTGYNAGDTTSYLYDILDRVTTITPPAGVGVTQVTYSAPAADLSVDSYTETIGTGTANSARTIVTFDGQFRVVKQQSTDPNGSGLVTVDTQYDDFGRQWLVSNPYSASSTTTNGWTRTLYDDQNRVVKVSSFDNGPSSPPTATEASDTGDVTTVYNVTGETKPTVTVTDQAGVQRKTWMDGVGQLVMVREAPNGSNYLTSYGYDGRGNLTGVTQGSQTRTYTFDGLSRLKSAKNPEAVDGSNVQVATSYAYDRESNLVTKTDARGAGYAITYTYDEMNRVRTKNYANTSVNDVSYFYDDSSYAPSPEIPDNTGLLPSTPYDRGSSLGRLVGVVTNATTAAETEQKRTGVFYGYDVAGRVTHYDQLLDTTHWQNPSVPTYNRASEVTAQTYPSGSTVANTFNVSGSMTGVSGTLGSATAASSLMSYVPSGALASERFSSTTTLYHTISYNSRFQPTQISLGVSSGATDKLGLSYQYGKMGSIDQGTNPVSTQNNGNVARITVLPGSGTTFDQYYNYDDLNRLTRAVEYFGTGGSGSCTGAPAAPSAVSATASGASVTVSWTDNASGANNETAFRIQRSSDGGTTWGNDATVGSGVTTWTDPSVPVGPTYLYRVRAENTCGASAYAQSGPVVPTGQCSNAPAATSGMQGVKQGKPIYVFWADNASGADNETSVRVERTLTSASPAVWSAVSGELPADTHDFLDTSVAALTSYRYRVVSTNACGSTIGSESVGIVSGSSTGCAAGPNATSGLTATVISSTQVNLTWTDTTSGINNELAFRVERSADFGATWRVLSTTVAADATTYADTTAHAQTSYQYRVRAENECGVGAYATSLQVTTPGGANDYALDFTLGQNATGGSSGENVPAANMTIEAWIRPTQLGNDKAIVSKRGGSGAYYELRATTVAGNKVIFEISASGVTDSITSDELLTLNTWTHVSGGYSGTKLFVTVNGVYKEKASMTARPTTVTAWSTKVAQGGASGQWSWAGRIDQVRLSNSARYTATFVPSRTYGNDANTRAYWPMNEGTGTTANDILTPAFASNATNNALTLSAGAAWGQGVGSTAASGTETIGIYDAPTSTFFLRNELAGGGADAAFSLGAVGTTYVALTGDWNGDGTDSAGLYEPATGNFYLRNANSSGAADYVYGFGAGGGGYIPLVGDWDGDGVDTIGLYEPVTSTFFLRNAHAAGAADLTYSFGPASSGWKPVAGDWDGNGTDTVGLYDAVNGSFFLKNTHAAGAADIVFGFGPTGATSWVPVAGDWDGNGIQTVGLYEPTAGAFYLRDTNTSGVADYLVQFGAANETPVVGDWDGGGYGPKAAPSKRHKMSVFETTEVETSQPTGEQPPSTEPAGESAEKVAVVNWDQALGYDQYGNRTTGGPSVSGVTNRITATNYGYDFAGNLTKQPSASTYVTMEYDAENRLVRVKNSSSVVISRYTYDGEGNRVRREVPAGTPTLTRYVYGISGALIAEYTTSTTTPSKEYLYGASGLLATAESGTVKYVTPDHLGTPRVITSSAGAVVSRHDYQPFGEELFTSTTGRTTALNYTASDNTSTRQKFTSKERDTETNLDYFEARYFSSAQGRFLSCDEFSGGPDELYDFADDASENPTFYADLGNPQSLNKYSYCFNNPLAFVDPDGHDPLDPQMVIPGRGFLPPPPPFMTPKQQREMNRAMQRAQHDIEDFGRWLVDQFFPPPPPPPPAPTQETPTAETAPAPNAAPTSGPAPPPPPAQAEHTKRRGSKKRTNTKHTDPRPGRPNTKDRQNWPKPKPKAKEPTRQPGAPRENKYDPKYPPGSTKRPQNPRPPDAKPN